MHYVVNVLAHVNHGKTTFMDNILAYDGALSRTMSGAARLLDSRKDELERGITMKLSPITVAYRGAQISFLDTPGHLEFNSLTLSTCMIADMSVVVVDAGKGVTGRLQALLRTALQRKVKVLLFINKLDALFRLGLSDDEISGRVAEMAAKVNQLLCQSGGAQVDWESNSMAIGSAKENYAASALSVAAAAERCRDLLGKPGEGRSRRGWSLGRTVALLRRLHTLDESKCEQVKEKLGLRVKRCTRKEVMSTLLPLSECVMGAIAGSGIDASGAEPAIKGLLGFNVLVDNEVVGVVKINRGVVRKNDLVVLYEEGAFKPSVAGKVLEFRSSGPREVAEGAGLVGVLGIASQKRGVLVDTGCGAGCGPEEARLLVQGLQEDSALREQLERVEWPLFRPVYTDVIRPERAHREELAEKVSKLARCEPSLVSTVAPDGDIVVKSDGDLQLEKILADLEGHKFTVHEHDQNQRFLETIRKKSAWGAFTMGHRAYKVQLAPLLSHAGGAGEPGHPGSKLARQCFLEYSGDQEDEGRIRREVLLFVRQGPYLREEVDLVLFTVTGASPSGAAAEAEVDDDMRRVLGALYLGSSPQVITNYVLVDISIPRGYIKQVASLVAQEHAVIIDREDNGEEGLTFRAKVALGLSRALINRVRSATRGDSEIVIASGEFLERVEAQGLESSLAQQIRIRKGLHQERQLVGDPSKQRTRRH